MRGWSRTGWAVAAVLVAMEAWLVHLDQVQVRFASTTAGVVQESGAWFGRDVPGYDSWSRIVYGLPQAWTVVGLLLVAVSAALWRDSRVALLAAPLALVTGVLPSGRYASSAALLATALLAVAGGRSARWRVLQAAGWLVALVVASLVAGGAGRTATAVEEGSTAHLAGRVVVPVLFVVALVFMCLAVVPPPTASRTRAAGEPAVRRRAWTAVAVAGAVQLALIGGVVIERLSDLVRTEADERVRTVTVAIAQFTDEPWPEPQVVDLLAVLTVLGALSLAVAAVAALLLRSAHPLVVGAVGCFALALLPVGPVVRPVLALAGLAILGFVALRTPRDHLG